MAEFKEVQKGTGKVVLVAGLYAVFLCSVIKS